MDATHLALLAAGGLILASTLTMRSAWIPVVILLALVAVVVWRRTAPRRRVRLAQKAPVPAPAPAPEALAISDVEEALVEEEAQADAEILAATEEAVLSSLPRPDPLDVMEGVAAQSFARPTQLREPLHAREEFLRFLAHDYDAFAVKDRHAIRRGAANGISRRPAPY